MPFTLRMPATHRGQTLIRVIYLFCSFSFLFRLFFGVAHAHARSNVILSSMYSTWISFSLSVAALSAKRRSTFYPYLNVAALGVCLCARTRI